MARSTNPDWTQTVGQLCLSAALELGAVGLGDSLDSEEEREMITRLNSMLAKWAMDGALYREASTVLPVPAGTDPVTLSSEIRDVRAIDFVQSATNSRPLAYWNRDQYRQLPNRSQQTATPMAYYFSKQLGGGQLYLWPWPSVDIDLDIDYNRQFFFAEGPEQEPDIPPEWHEAALYGLASRCAGIFDTVALNTAAVQRCDQKAASTYQQALDADRPDSYFFQYDSPVEAR